MLAGKDTFGNIGMTIIDSLTTLWLMGLKKEFDQGSLLLEGYLHSLVLSIAIAVHACCKLPDIKIVGGTAFVENELDFDQADREISVFEACTCVAVES